MLFPGRTVFLSMATSEDQPLWFRHGLKRRGKKDRQNVLFTSFLERFENEERSDGMGRTGRTAIFSLWNWTLYASLSELRIIHSLESGTMKIRSPARAETILGVQLSPADLLLTDYILARRVPIYRMGRN